MSTPFVDEEFTFTQPDGSTVTLIGTGNAHQATFRTPDGYTVVQDSTTGAFHLAEPEPATGRLVASATLAGDTMPLMAGLERNLAPPGAEGEESFVSEGVPDEPMRWQVRRQEAKLGSLAARQDATMAPPQRQTVGTYVGLCLLIDFTDFPATITQAEVEDFCNQRGYTGFGNNGSVCDYFFDVSDGKLTYTNVVAPYYRAQHPRSYYTDRTIAKTKRAKELIVEALTHHKANGFNFAPLTSDGAGYIYAINVFYAGVRDNNWSEGLWPHASSLRPPMTLAPGKVAHDYQITDMGNALTLGTFCHENGHLICDFPDLYEYGRKTKGVGSFCLMCVGGSNKTNPHHVGAYLKLSAGWDSSVTTITPGQVITLAAGRNEFALYERNPAEYYVIENRAQAARDATLPDAGLAIWRCDEVGSNTHPAGTHYECALVQADNAFNIEKGVNSGDPNDLYDNVPGVAFADNTSPSSSWWDANLSNLKISNVSAAGATMTFST